MDNHYRSSLSGSAIPLHKCTEGCKEEQCEKRNSVISARVRNTRFAVVSVTTDPTARQPARSATSTATVGEDDAHHDATGDDAVVAPRSWNEP